MTYEINFTESELMGRFHPRLFPTTIAYWKGQGWIKPITEQRKGKKIDVYPIDQVRLIETAYGFMDKGDSPSVAFEKASEPNILIFEKVSG